MRVDLILESEQRSASVVNLKSVIRISSVSLPVILLVIVASIAVNMITLNSELKMLEGEVQAIGSKEKTAETLIKGFAVNREIMNELEGWRKSHIDWYEQLLAMQKEVPSEIQLSAMRISHEFDLIDKKIPVRAFTVALEGNTTGERAELNVHRLKRGLEDSPVLSLAVKEKGVEVSRFEAAIGKEASKDDRIFQIECKYRVRRFE